MEKGSLAGYPGQGGDQSGGSGYRMLPFLVLAFMPSRKEGIMPYPQGCGTGYGYSPVLPGWKSRPGKLVGRPRLAEAMVAPALSRQDQGCRTGYGTGRFGQICLVRDD